MVRIVPPLWLLLLPFRSQRGGMYMPNASWRRRGSKRQGLRAKLFGGPRFSVDGTKTRRANGLAVREGSALSKVWFPYSARSAPIYEEGVAGGNVPLRWVAQDAERPGPGRRLLPQGTVEEINYDLVRAPARADLSTTSEISYCGSLSVPFKTNSKMFRNHPMARSGLFAANHPTIMRRNPAII